MRDGAWRLTLGAALACAAGLGVVVAVVALAAGALGIGSLLHVAVEESPGPSGSTRGRVDSSTAPATADDRVTRSGEPEPEPGREPAVDPSAAIPGFTFVETNAAGYPEFQHDESGIVFVRLPGGKFEMGSPPDEEGRGDDEGPVRSVELSSFLIAKYEVTQAQFRKVTGTNPSAFEGDDSRPVESVTWTELHAEDGFLARTGLWSPRTRAGLVIAFSTTGIVQDEPQGPAVDLHLVGEEGLYALFDSAAFAAEEAVFDALLQAEAIEGLDVLPQTGWPEAVRRFWREG